MSDFQSEQQARQQIDQQLNAAGWVVQNVKSINLSAQCGVAVCEFPTATGPADYMLFADGKAIGIVEAKKEGVTFSAVHTQAAEYSTASTKHIQRWADPLPFIYETTGIDPVAKVTVSTIRLLYAQLAGKEMEEDLDEHSVYELAAIEPDDFEDVPFNQKGGLAKARKLFGKDFKSALEDLNTALVG
jgi:type I site-specific restriction endonuclease